jgi:hypothetical protein
MKLTRLNLLPMAALLLFATSCNKLRHLADINFNLPYSQEFAAPAIDSTVPIPPGGLPVSLPAVAVPTNSKTEMEKNNISSDLITVVKLKSFSQKTTTGNFNFTDTLQVYMSAPGLPETLLAYKNGIPVNTDNIVFDCTDKNLKEYFLQDTVYLRMQGHFKTAPPAAQYKTEFTFGITANPVKEQQ